MLILLGVVTALVIVLIVLRAIALGRKNSRPDLMAPPPNPKLPPDVEKRGRELAASGEVIAAVKLVRRSSELDLKDARDLVRRWERE